MSVKEEANRIRMPGGIAASCILAANGEAMKLAVFNPARAASTRRNELEADHAGDDEGEATEPDRVGRFAECHHADDHRAGGADAGPDRIGGPEWHRFKRQPEQAEAQKDRRSGSPARPEPGEPAQKFETHGPGDLEHSGH